MRYATFLNFTDKPFTAFWNGKPYTIQPGKKQEHIQEGIARHFAKHLANKVLIEAGKEQYTSPKKPIEVPEFMNVFNKAFFLENEGKESDAETGLVPDINGTNQPGMNVNVLSRKAADPYDASAQPMVGPGDKPQVVDELNATDDESSFEKP